MPKKLRGYIFSRPFVGERVPQHIQNLVIKNFCEQNNFTFLLSATEYAMDQSTYILEKILNELKSVDGLAFYSLYQLPEDMNYRLNVLKKIFSKEKVLLAACERLVFKKIEDIDRINKLWLIKNTLPNCYKSNL